MEYPAAKYSLTALCSSKGSEPPRSGCCDHSVNFTWNIIPTMAYADQNSNLITTKLSTASILWGKYQATSAPIKSSIAPVDWSVTFSQSSWIALLKKCFTQSKCMEHLEKSFPPRKLVPACSVLILSATPPHTIHDSCFDQIKP